MYSLDEKVSLKTQETMTQNFDILNASNKTKSSVSDRPLEISEGLSNRIKSSFGIDSDELSMSESQDVHNQGMNASAQGNRVRFAPGKFRPDTQAGLGLIGHELFHVKSQAENNFQPNVEGTNIHFDAAHEAGSDAAGTSFASGNLSADSSVSLSSTSADSAPVQGSFWDSIKNKVVGEKDGTTGKRGGGLISPIYDPSKGTSRNISSVTGTLGGVLGVGSDTASTVGSFMKANGKDDSGASIAGGSMDILSGVIGLGGDAANIYGGAKGLMDKKGREDLAQKAGVSQLAIGATNLLDIGSGVSSAFGNLSSIGGGIAGITDAKTSGGNEDAESAGNVLGYMSSGFSILGNIASMTSGGIKSRINSKIVDKKRDALGASLAQFAMEFADAKIAKEISQMTEEEKNKLNDVAKGQMKKNIMLSIGLVEEGTGAFAVPKGQLKDIRKKVFDEATALQNADFDKRIEEFKTESNELQESKAQASHDKRKERFGMIQNAIGALGSTSKIVGQATGIPLLGAFGGLAATAGTLVTKGISSLWQRNKKKKAEAKKL